MTVDADGRQEFAKVDPCARKRATSGACSARCCATRPASTATSASSASGRKRCGFAAPSGAEAQAVRAGLEAQLNALEPRPDAGRGARLQLLPAPAERRGGPPDQPAGAASASARARRPSPAVSPARSPACAPAARTRPRWTVVRARHGGAGAHRASDRSAAPEHPGLRTRHRRRVVAAGGRRGWARPSARAIEARLQARVLTLWQTAMIRLARLRVIDEIENALSFYRLTFLAEMPRLYEDMEAELGPLRAANRCRSCCAWVPGSAATATAIRSSPPTCCAKR